MRLIEISYNNTDQKKYRMYEKKITLCGKKCAEYDFGVNAEYGDIFSIFL